MTKIIDTRRFLIGAIGGALGGAISFWLVSAQNFNLWKLSSFGAVFGIVVAWLVKYIKK
jgi:hypothetical protein